jgi:hypothetical protein
MCPARPSEGIRAQLVQERLNVFECLCVFLCLNNEGEFVVLRDEGKEEWGECEGKKRKKKQRREKDMGEGRKKKRAQRNFLLASSLAFFHTMKPTPKHTCNHHHNTHTTTHTVTTKETKWYGQKGLRTEHTHAHAHHGRTRHTERGTGEECVTDLEETKIDPPRDGAALLHDALELLLAGLELLEGVVLVSVAPLHHPPRHRRR